MRTPWGESDSSKQYAEGITFYGTPSHGGFHLSAKQNRLVPDYLRDATWGDLGAGGWYEEDCDWSIVAVVFPHLFTAEDLENARRTLATYHPEQLKRFDEESTRKPQSDFGQFLFESLGDMVRAQQTAYRAGVEVGKQHTGNTIAELTETVKRAEENPTAGDPDVMRSLGV